MASAFSSKLEHHTYAAVGEQPLNTPVSLSSNRLWIDSLVWYSSAVVAVLSIISYFKNGGDPLVLSTLILSVGSLPALASLHRGSLSMDALQGWTTIAVLHCSDLVLTNIALSLTDIRPIFIIKALEPLLVCLFSTVFGTEGVVPVTVAVCAALAAANALAMFQEWSAPIFESRALFITIVATVAGAAKMTLFKDAMPQSDSPRALYISFSTMNIPSLACCMTCLLARPMPSIISSFTPSTGLQLVAAVAFSLVYQAMSFSLITSVRSTTHAVNAVLKRALIGLCAVTQANGILAWTTYLAYASLTILPAGLGRMTSTSQARPSSFVDLKTSTRRLLIASTLLSTLLAVVMSTDGQSPISASLRSSSLLQKIRKVETPADLERKETQLAEFVAQCDPASHRYEIWHWAMHKNGGTQNFGDEIGPALVARMLGFDMPLYWKSNPNPGPRLLTIGTIANAHVVQPCDIIWGSGSRNYDNVPVTPQIQVRAMRGPLSRRGVLRSHPDLYVPEIYGDPALLLPHYFPELKRVQLPGDKLDTRVIVMPHYKDIALGLVEEADWYRIVSPAAENWLDVIHEILNATFVISSSLHGLIVADAFGVPSRGIRYSDAEADFKYIDYYQGTGRTNHRRASSPGQAFWMGPEDPIEGWDAQALIDAFPFEWFQNSHV